ncbi:MAG: 3-oxoacyl-ACP reductase FabG [Proteobacteria bacterium]|nr:3-oxoacyl-ACP reductase FabG [Pseudomonadota bacterium]MBU4581290.1 3-oxoacyl-ACP reductase FabG [Pseudomonadota bacterium]MCG2738861.1 3-oxoacyl-ACP reductase FabG [Syntrophaceae bacterium]
MGEQKIAVVTGGSRGIGRAIAVELAAHGYQIVITYKTNDEAAAETLRLIREAGGSGEAVKFDVGNAAEAEGAINDLLGRLERIDVLVNNAGMTADGLFLMMPRRDWDAVIDTTLHGFYNMTKPVLRKMLRRKSGAIVSLSSVSALVGNRGQANYAAAKAGLIAASRVLASEVARLGVRVNVVAPGPIDTEMIRDTPLENIKQMIPMGRIGRPEEVAKVVRFLCSDDASYITGQVISVNGGMF